MTTFYSSPGFVHETMAGPAAWKNIVIILRAVVNREPALLLISLNIMW